MYLGIVGVRQPIRVEVPLIRVISDVMAERRCQCPMKPFNLSVCLRVVASSEMITHPQCKADGLEKLTVKRRSVVSEECSWGPIGKHPVFTNACATFHALVRKSGAVHTSLV